jgi:hypothetical protein
MEMNESTQHMIMTAIQELMSKDPNSHVVKSTSSLSLGLSADDDISNQVIVLAIHIIIMALFMNNFLMSSLKKWSWI